MSRAILDVDGVIADFAGYLLRLVAPALRVEDITTWDVFGYLNEDQGNAARLILANPDFWRTQPTILGAIDGVAFIRRAFDEVVFVTSPWPGCAGWGNARKAWLAEKLGVERKSVHISECKYPISGDVFVDDKPSHVLAWMQHNPQGEGYVFGAPHNRGLLGIPRLTWATVQTVLGGSP